MWWWWRWNVVQIFRYSSLIWSTKSKLMCRVGFRRIWWWSILCVSRERVSECDWNMHCIRNSMLSILANTEQIAIVFAITQMCALYVHFGFNVKSSYSSKKSVKYIYWCVDCVVHHFVCMHLIPDNCEKGGENSFFYSLMFDKQFFNHVNFRPFLPPAITTDYTLSLLIFGYCAISKWILTSIVLTAYIF